MDDAISRYRTASEAGDIDGIMATLTPDVELVSPISGRMIFRGSDDVGILVAGVYNNLKGLRWTDALGAGERRVLVGEARLLGVRLTDAMVLDLSSDGRIRRIDPHLRPWLALSLFAVILGPKLVLHPGAIRRALARDS
jgi:hypothetical protein